jgi:hypothetical protein
LLLELTDNIKPEAPTQVDVETTATPIEPFVEEAPASLFTEPEFPVDETHTSFSEEVEYPINDEAEELDQKEVDDSERAKEEEVVVQEDTPPVVETASKTGVSSENAMPLRATRRFQTVGNPEFKVVGVRPKRPSRFVTVGKEDFKTIKASISSMTDIYKASPQADDENDKEREETVEEEDDATGSHTYEEDGSHAMEPEESPSGSAADDDEETEHPEDNAVAAGSANVEEEEFHTAIDNSEAVPSGAKSTVTAAETPKESTEGSRLDAEAESAPRADASLDAGPDL